MRLSPEQAATIRRVVTETFGGNARTRLFGSRVDDRERGGDIDLFVEVDHPLANRAAAASRLAAGLQIALGEQRIDVVLVDPETRPLPIHDEARRHGLAL